MEATYKAIQPLASPDISCEENNTSQHSQSLNSDLNFEQVHKYKDHAEKLSPEWILNISQEQSQFLQGTGVFLQQLSDEWRGGGKATPLVFPSLTAAICSIQWHPLCQQLHRGMAQQLDPFRLLTCLRFWEKTWKIKRK